MSNGPNAVKVTLLDKEYLVACAPSEYEELYESARHLDQKMREIRDSGKIIGLDRIAVMAALNLAHEMLQQQKENVGLDHTVSDRIRLLQDKVDSALSST